MKLDLSPFERAIGQLGLGLERANADPADDLLRDGVIQRFEYTYELAHKMLRRFLALTESSRDAVAEVTFQELIRLGAERGLLQNSWDAWEKFRAARGTTSHTYDAKRAREVYARIPAFLEEARFLLAALAARPVEP